VAGADGAEEIAGDFGLAGEALAVVHGDFQDVEAEAVGLDLHFDGPAVGGVAHLQAIEGWAADGAEGAEVGVAHAEKQAHESGGEPVAKGLGRGEGTGTASRFGAGAEDEVRGAVENGPEQAREVPRVVAPVGVEEDDDFAFGGESGDSREASLAVATAGFVDDTGAAFGSDAGGGVGRTVVYDKEFGLVDARGGQRGAEGI